MRRKTLSAFVLLVGMGISASALATVPDLLPVQGVLADSTGAPVDALTDITFTLYDDDAGTTTLWTDTFADVDVDEGFFTVYLGSSAALDFSTLISNSEIWMGIAVETDPEMDLIQLASVPFALEAGTCNSVGSLTETDINNDFMSSSYVPDWSDLTGVPPEFGDGTDEVDDTVDWSEISGIVGTTASTVAEGDHNHDMVYSPLGHNHDTDYAPLGHDHDSDYISTSAPAASITSTQTTNWDTAYGWGDHSSAGYLTSYTETDPVYGASAAAGISSTNISAWNTAYGWGNHASVGYLTSYTETDPVFIAHTAYGITSTQTSNWDTAYGWGNHASAGYLTAYTETDPSVDMLTTSAVPRWNGTELEDGNIWDDGTNVAMMTTNPSNPVQIGGGGTATEYLDISNSTFNLGTYGVDQWQTFIPTRSGELTTISIHLNGYSGQPTSGTFSIYEGAGTGGTLLHQQPMAFYTTNFWQAQNISATVKVTAGQTYTYRMQTPTGYDLVLRDDNPVSGYYYSNVYGTQANWDLTERIYINELPDPPHMLVDSDGDVGFSIETPQRSVHIGDVMRLEPLDVAPSSPSAGDIYFDSGLAQLRYYNGTTWVNL